MSKIHFTGEDGAFTIKNPENYSGLYFPIAGEKGLKSAVTPNMGGDSKIDQETFLLEPVSVENLHNNRSRSTVPASTHFPNILSGQSAILQ